jgi:enoyl-CoA hydratase/carnithine racemase
MDASRRADDEPLVLSEFRDPYTRVLTLNRPGELNSWGPDMEAEFFSAFDSAMSAESDRVVVITGAGRGFCGGASLALLERIRAGDPTLPKADDPERRRLCELAEAPKPVVAAVNGAAAGMGLALALFCDVRFASSAAKLTTAFARRGLIAEHGVAWILPRLVGAAAASDLLLSGRVVSGSEAATMGLVNRSIDPGDVLHAALDYAAELALHGCPASWAVIKRQLLSNSGLPLREAFQDSMGLMTAAHASPEFAEGIAAFLERRRPRFSPLRSASL